MRKKIYEIINSSEDQSFLSKIYDILMIVAICLSIVPLITKNQYPAFDYIDKICVAIFIIDYVLRLITADCKDESKHIVSILKYPFTPMAIVDLISILPSLTVLNKGFKILRLLRLIRALRVFRVFKLFRYSKNFATIVTVFKKQKSTLLCVLVLSVSYIIISALIIFNVESESFNNFFDAIYWATVSLTTVGYGDIYPVSTVGRIIAMVSSLFGIAIVALPAGIITAGFMEEINKSN